MKIKKFLLSTFILITMILMLTGCLERIEINKIGIVAALGIDKTDDGYIVTAQILNPSAITGERGNSLPVYNFKSEGLSIHEAYRKLDQITTSALALSHLNIIVVDEKFAKDGIAPILNFALRRDDIRPDITILVAKDATANEILSVVTPLDMIPATQIDVAQFIDTHTARLTNYNLYEIVDMVNPKSSNVVLNAVSIYHAEDEKSEKDVEKDVKKGKDIGATTDNLNNIKAPVQLRIEHLAAFQGDKLVGFLNTSEAQLYNIVQGTYKRYDIVTRIGEDYYTSLRVTELKSKITTNLANNEATISMKMKGIIQENTYPADFTNQDNLDAVAAYLKAHLESEMETFVAKIQGDLKSDIFGIGVKAYTQEKKLWKEITGYWEEMFPNLDIKLEIELEINSVGEIGNVTL